MNQFHSAEHCTISRSIYDQVELAGKRIFMVHLDTLHDIVAASGMFDLVCYGHNHLRDVHTVGETTVCNPGAVCGNKQSPSYALYDTETHAIDFVEFMSE